MKYISREEMFNKLEQGYEISHDCLYDGYIYLDLYNELRDENELYLMGKEEDDFRTCDFFKNKHWQTGWFMKGEN